MPITSETLWSYYRYEVNANESDTKINRINNNKTITSKNQTNIRHK